MKVLKEKLTCLCNNKFDWEYYNLDTGEKGTVQMESSVNMDKITSIDNDTNKYLSYGTISFQEISTETNNRQMKGRINYDNFRSKPKRWSW